MKAIRFPGPIGLTQTFTTIRIGQHWLEELEEGETLQLEDPKGNFLGLAKAMDVWSGDLALVPASLLTLSSDPLARTYDGLIMMLRSNNPHDEIAPESKVTVIVFEFLGRRKPGPSLITP